MTFSRRRPGRRADEMSGQTGQLQRLTDEQVSARLAAYNGDGSLDRDVALLRDEATDIIGEEIIAQFGNERAERFAANYAGKVDSRWIQAVAEYGRQIYADHVPVPLYMSARIQVSERIVARVVERFSADSEKLERVLCALQRVSTIE